MKTPVLSDPASRAKLNEKASVKLSERNEDYLELGFLEWKKTYDELKGAGKKSVLFCMTDDTRNCDEVAEHLEGRYPARPKTASPRPACVSQTHFRIEYRNADGSISNYIPDFVVKHTPGEIWVVETKGRQDLDDPIKWKRLVQWCEDASKLNSAFEYRALLVKEEVWDKHRAKSFAEATKVYEQS